MQDKYSRKPRGVKVRPRKIAEIRATAMKARMVLDVKTPAVDIVGLYEFELAKIGLVYDICDFAELRNDHGLTFPNDGAIKIREDVWDGACVGQGRDRFTMSHELGHLFLHDNVAFARSNVEHKWYEDSEWQADTFAAEFMMPVEHIRRGDTVEDLVKRFGVSYDAAANRLRKLAMAK